MNVDQKYPKEKGEVSLALNARSNFKTPTSKAEVQVVGPDWPEPTWPVLPAE
jgi:hypothetical protein